LAAVHVSKDAFALRVSGDSMMPEFRHGDVIIVDPAVRPRPGSYVVATTGEHDATFKRYRLVETLQSGEAVFELIPLNSFYPTIRSDRATLGIVGTVVLHQRQLFQ
jgi:SOS-response transcriptional repressor LexA